MRFVGAFIFGRIGDAIGRKPALMIDILCYSVIGAAAAFSPNLTVFLVLRALFGVAMGGEWGLGSLAGDGIDPAAGARRRCPACCRRAIPAASCSPPSSTACSTAATSAAIEIDWRVMFLF